MPGPAVPATGPLGGACGGDGWDGGPLTGQQAAGLGAGDRAGDPEGEPWLLGAGDRAGDPEGEPWLLGAGDWAGDRTGGEWLGGLGFEPWDDEPDEAAVAGVLPGLMPRQWGRDGGFGAGGVADRVPPGPVLAGLAADKHGAGLAVASDDELAGLMIAWRRLGSWAAAGELAAVAELDRRRTAQAAAAGDPRLAEHVADEVAMALTLTGRAADRLTVAAAGLARLPAARAALRAGDIDLPRALVLVEELAGLAGPHAARVDAAVSGAAPGQTTGELRRAARRAVLAADPAAARVRKENAAREARVECWPEPAGTAALAGRDLPPAETLAADRRLTACARQLKAAGAGGTLDQLRARVYLALLNAQPVASLLPGQAGDRPAPSTNTCIGGTAAGVAPGPAADGTAHSWSPTGSAGPGGPAHRDTGPGPAAGGSVHLVVPLATWLGWGQGPAEVAGFGPVDAADSRALAAALARGPATRWCLTLTGPGGRPAAHGCATTGPAATGSGQPPGDPGAGQPPGATTAQTGPPRRSQGRGPPGPPPGLAAWLAGIGLAWLETGTCAHRRQSPGYRPPAPLAHMIQIRNQTCAAPGCRRPATACDFEHTLPYHHGGRTCECNAAPRICHSHRAETPRIARANPSSAEGTHGQTIHVLPALAVALI